MSFTMAEGQDDMDKQLNCPICLETFESPKVLACLHTFCEKCISKHVSGLREEGTLLDIISCPVCRSPTPAPASDRTTEDWSSNLPPNSIVIGLLASDQSKKDDPVYCQPCLTNDQHQPSVAYCVTCMEYLCQTCHDCHKKFKVSKGHTFTIHTLPTSPNLNPAENSMYRCSKHIKKYKYLCQQHKELCCCKCAFEYHRHCDGLFTLEHLLKDTKEKGHNQTTLDYLDVLKEMFLTLIKHRTKTLESIPQQNTDITTTIKDLTKSVKDHVDQLELSTLQELEQICKQETLAISDDIVECKSAIAAIETSQKMLLELINSDEIELFTTTTKVSQHVLNYLRNYDTLERKSEEIKIKFHCDEPFEKMINSLNSLGQWSRETSPIPRLSSAFSFDKLAMLIPCARPDSIAMINAKLSDDITDCHIYSGIFLHDGKILLSDQKNRKLKLFDKCFHFSCHLNMVYEPRHVCVIDQQNAAVTTGEESIDIVAVTNILTRLRTIHVKFNCYGVASCQQNIIVDVSINGRDSLLKSDASFKIVEKIDSYDKLTHRCNTHCVNPAGENIYYTNENKIVTMDKKGRRLNTFESDNLKKAYGITLDRNGIIYCCGYDSNTVVLITEEGRELGVLLSSEHGLNKPLGICLNDNNNMIMVFEEASNIVKIFRLLYQ